jgi:hypothetical protein
VCTGVGGGGYVFFVIVDGEEVRWFWF